MIKFYFILSLLFLIFIDLSRACINGTGFLPENDLYIPVTESTLRSGVSQSQFNSVLDRVEKHYRPVIQSYGGNLVMQRLWNDGTVNAQANRQGNNFIVTMFGGLARHSTITSDAFALVACHEVGHHIGGVPRYSSQGTWASTEGQSDYFATTKCLRKIFEEDDNQAIMSSVQVDPLVVSKCEEQFTTQEEQSLCQRISMASLSSASLFASLQNRPFPRFETPDNRVVSSTFESHPDYQCRLDTYFAGATCEISHEVEIGQNNPNVGTCNRVDNFTQGLRPLCWYKPSTQPGPNPTPSPTPTPTPNPAGLAATPLVNGQTSIRANNPSMLIPIFLNVANIPGAYGMAVEFSRPNTKFSNPNSQRPDPVNSLRVEVYGGTSGNYSLVPIRHLPSWGRYEIRVIALDRNKKPVSKNSNPFELLLFP